MSIQDLLPSAVLGTVLTILAGCLSQTEQASSVIQEQELTSDIAREALLEMMRSEPGEELGWFDGDIPEAMAKMKTEELENGWFAWTGAFRFHPSKAIYTFVVRPRPGVRACVFEYQGTFVSKNGRWAATPPELVSTALQAGE